MASAKQNAIRNWINEHVGETFSTVQLAKDLGISLPTLLSYIKNNEDRFSKVKHGAYRIEAVATQLGGDDLDDVPFAPAVATSNNAPLTYHPTGDIPFPLSPVQSPVQVVTIEVETPIIDTQDTVQSVSQADRPFDW
jgi:hypothetical protein